MKDPLENIRCWVMTTSDTGTVNQAIGLANAIGIPYQKKTIQLKPFWRALPNCYTSRINTLNKLTADSDPLQPPFPDLLISCGRQTVATAITLRSLNKTFTVHVQNPQVAVHHFDLVIPPEHDQIQGKNVYATQGALHNLTRKDLADAASHFSPQFSHFKRPIVSVLIGGNSKAYSMSSKHMENLATQVKQVIAKYQASVLITTSRRTGVQNKKILSLALKDSGAWIWDGHGENPYLGMLALADFIIVTEDSVSMVSEACYTGKPVYISRLKGKSQRIKRFHSSFMERNYTRPFTGELTTWHYPPPQENQRIATLIREHLCSRLSPTTAIGKTNLL